MFKNQQKSGQSGQNANKSSILYVQFAVTTVAEKASKWPPKTLGVAPRMEFRRWSYISTPSWTVLASILEGLGVDFVPLGAQLGSNLASESTPDPPKSAQETPKRAQEPPESRPRAPKSCPRASKNVQEPPKTGGGGTFPPKGSSINQK